jgi:hypothetical protein
MVFSQAEQNFIAGYLRRESINRNNHLPPILVSTLALRPKHVLESEMDTGDG